MGIGKRSAARYVFAAVLLAMATAACASDAEGRVFFEEPRDEAVVVSPVPVVMGAEGFIIEPASEGVGDGRGHFHIIIDRPCVQPRLTVGADGEHLHFGGGQETALLELEPGEHTLCLQVADGSHTALDLTDEIAIIVE
ncbi:MAG: DUF4399 domain-containing protein [Acidimicrobiia bacterium]